MPLSDFYPELKGWKPVENSPGPKPQMPTAEVQQSPYLRTVLPLPMQYAPDTLKQYNKPGLSSFRIAPLAPNAIPSANSASISTTTPVTNAAIANSSSGIQSASLSMPDIFSVAGSPILPSQGTFVVSLSPEPANTLFSGPPVSGLDKVVTNSAINVGAATISATPTSAGEWGLLLGVVGYQQVVQFSAGAGWTVINTLSQEGGVAGQLFTTNATVNVSSSMSPSRSFQMAIAYFAVKVAGVPPAILGSGSAVNLVSNGSINLGTNTAGNKIIVCVLNSDTTQDVPAAGVSISDTNNNVYSPIVQQFGGGGNTTQLFLFMADNIAAGANTVSFTFGGPRIRGEVYIAEVSGIGGGSGLPSFRSLVASDIPPLNANKITSGLLALARGGTNADLSGTGGTSRVLRQSTVGAAITVSQLSLSDIIVPNQNANTVYAGPASGAAAAPTFRSIVANDIGGGTNASISTWLRGDLTWNSLPATTPIFNRKVISSLTYTTLLADVGFALDIQTAAATTITLSNPAQPVFVQAANTTSGGSPAPLAYGSNNTAGNLLVCAVDARNSNPVTYTITDTAGNTWIKAPGSFFSHSNSEVALWYVPSCRAGANTVTLTITNQFTPRPRFVIAEYSGVAAFLPLDTQAGAQGTGTASSSGNITTTNAIDLLVGFTISETVGSTNTPAAGWTARSNTTGNDMWYYDRIVTAIGINSFSSTWGTSVQWGDFIGAFKAAPTPGFSGFIQNNGTAIVTLTPASGLINGLASIQLFPGQGCTVATDGANFTAVLWDPGVVAKVDLTAQAAAITATTLYAVPTGKAGMYRVSWSTKITQAATTSSTLAGTNGFQVTYTDADDSVVVTPLAKPNAVATGNTTGTQLSGVEIVNAKAGTNIQYQIDYTSGGATPMQYNLHIKAEYLG